MLDTTKIPIINALSQGVFSFQEAESRNSGSIRVYRALRLQLMEADLEAEYARMAQNEERETNALAWSEGLISDGKNQKG